MQRRIEALVYWVERLPRAIRPAVYGALIIVFLSLVKGAWLVVPIAIVYVLLTSSQPLADIAFGAGIALLAMVGGAVSGLAYGIVGRHLRGASPGGRYAAGIVTVAPYVLAVMYIIRYAEHRQFWAPLSRVEIGIATFVTLLCGIVIGHSWFASEEKRADEPR